MGALHLYQNSSGAFFEILQLDEDPFSGIHYPDGFFDAQNKDPKAEIQKEIRKVLKDFSWSSPKKITGDDGQEYAWTTGFESAGMPFLVLENDSEKSEPMQGRMDICLTSNEKGTLIVVFRAPTEIFGHKEEALVEGTLKSIRGFK